MALLVGLQNRERLDPVVADELDFLIAALQTWVGRQEGLNAALQSTDVAGLVTGLATVPTGGMLAWPTATAPTGYVLCNGATLDRTTYAELFAVIGTTYGAPSGTTFSVPDLRGRYPFGKATSGTGSTLAGTFGAIDHTHTGPSHTHSHDHTHTVSGSTADEQGHEHAVSGSTAGPSSGSTQHEGGGGAFTVGDGTHTHGIAFNTSGGQAHSHGAGSLAADSGGGDTGAAGTGATGTNNPPSLAVNWIIKT